MKVPAQRANFDLRTGRDGGTRDLETFSKPLKSKDVLCDIECEFHPAGHFKTWFVVWPSTWK